MSRAAVRETERSNTASRDCAWRSKHRFQVGVRWPDGYGGVTSFETMAEAVAERERLRKFTGQPIDIREVTKVVTLDPERPE